MGKKIWLNGNLVDADQAKISVFDHGLLYGDGVFEGIRSYGGRLLKLATHLRRLAQSARSIRLEMPYTTDELADAIRQTVRANGCENGYIRICVTRGIGTLGLNPLTCKDSTVFVIADSITLYPEEYYQNGMGVITASTIRNHPAALSPRIKSMNYLNNIMAKVEALDAGCMEAVMLNHVGNVAECTGDNIFIVRNTPAPTPGSATGGSGGDDAQPRLMTPPLHAGILEGVTMNMVIGLAEREGIACERCDLTKHDLYTADEMFLTGTAAEIVPVVRVDQRRIGDGNVGPVTRRLADAYSAMVKNDAPED